MSENIKTEEKEEKSNLKNHLELFALHLNTRAKFFGEIVIKFLLELQRHFHKFSEPFEFIISQILIRSLCNKKRRQIAF